MHAVGTRARLPAARCLRAQSQAHVQALATTLLTAHRYENTRLSGITTPLISRLDTRQIRLVSSQPNGAPDKPEGNEKEDGKEKEEDIIQPAASTETTESPPETKSKPLFNPPSGSGRGRGGNGSGSSTGLPPVTLPPWFMDAYVKVSNSENSGSASAAKVWDKKWPYIQPGTSEDQGSVQDIGGIWASSEQRGEGEVDTPEQAIGRELLSTVSAELNARPPPGKATATKDSKRRPVSLLYVHNYKGSRVANDIVGHIAEDLGADVVHLDAVKLARVVGPYLGSTLYFGRENISMLGYTAAEANGRAAPASPSADSEDDFVIRGGMNVMKFLRPAEDRATWDDLKLKQVLREIVNAPEIKMKTNDAENTKKRRLILHIHNYVELNMTTEGISILNRLRTIVDRLWQEGSSVIIVGSASNDSTATPQWHAKVKELSIRDCYPIVFSPNSDELPGLKSWEKDDYLQDNLASINWMLECLKFDPAYVEISPKNFKSESSEAIEELITRLSSGILSNHWVFRLATQAIGLQRYKDGPLDISTLADALRQMKKVDEARLSTLGVQKSSRPESATAPHLPPSPLESLISLGNAITSETGPGKADSLPNNMNLDDEEKKLLAGLVNVDDIYTTFNDVIAPPEVRDSLIALTTLSLQHPKAFSYGVLARERIHGCLLYGPPGTGKTLMAKALAKGSGANMLEISAASINDMWVGNSEKNVRAVFSLARKMSPMVVFLDEADALLGSRGRQPNRGGQRETINQFLREWDGLTNALNTQQIFVMVSTNRPQDLDEAVLRRLPRRILVDLPLKDGRLAILQSLLRDEALDESVSLEKIATTTELYSGSDLKNLAVAAAMEAAKEELVAKNCHTGPEAYEFPTKRTLSKRHFDKALKDISASISEDMQSLKSIRKFDEQYGDARRKKKKTHMGFEVVPQVISSEEVRVRNK